MEEAAKALDRVEDSVAEVKAEDPVVEVKTEDSVVEVKAAAGSAVVAGELEE